MHRSRILAALLALGILGGCATPDAQPPTEAATAVEAPENPSTAVTPEPEPAQADEARPTPAGAADIPVSDASLGARTQEPAQAPARLQYDGLQIDMPVDPVGIADDGQMEVLDDAERAGWYRFGPGMDASAGSVVIAAHNGSFETGVGPFHLLPESAPGDVITLLGPDGAEVDYEVVSVEGESKEAIDLAAHFRRDGEPHLVLITCGGEWEADRQSYRDNVVVTAMLR